MSRYINVDKLIEFANNTKDHSIDSNDIARFPTADVRENVHGEWVKKSEWYDVPTICTKCGHDFTEYVTGYEFEATGDLPNFCPNCGAEMKGENDVCCL